MTAEKPPDVGTPANPNARRTCSTTPAGLTGWSRTGAEPSDLQELCTDDRTGCHDPGPSWGAGVVASGAFGSVGQA